MLVDAVTKALNEVNLAQFATSILVQDTRLHQSGSVGDEASAAQLVLKQAHAIRKLLINPRKEELIEMP